MADNFWMVGMSKGLMAEQLATSNMLAGQRWDD
jgi:hypothetical protein